MRHRRPGSESLHRVPERPGRRFVGLRPCGRPLAIVVVGAMLTTLFLTRYLMPVLYSFYGHREPRPEAGGFAE